MPTLHNKKLISADFEQKIFAHFLKCFADFRANFFWLKIGRNENFIMWCGCGEQTLSFWTFFLAKGSFQVSWRHQFLTDFKKNLNFVFFPLGLSNFGWGAWFPFNEGQSNSDILSIKLIITFLRSCVKKEKETPKLHSFPYEVLFS